MVKHAVSPAQESLIDHTMFGGEIPHDFSQVPVHESVDGPSVNLSERAQHLDGALELMGRISQRTGLQIAAEGKPREDLRRRYKNVNAVVDGALSNKHSMEREARWDFARGFGRFALSESGFMPDEEAGELTRGSFQEFTRAFADSKGRPNRDAFRKKLARAEKIRTTQQQKSA